MNANLKYIGGRLLTGVKASYAITHPGPALAGGLTFGTKRGRLLVEGVARRWGRSRRLQPAGRELHSFLTQTRPTYHQLRRFKASVQNALKRGPLNRRLQWLKD